MLRILAFGFAGVLFAACDEKSNTDRTAAPILENHPVENTDFRDGDIVFHISQSDQSKAIQLATGSKYSHCGIIYHSNQGGGLQVLEAIGPVKFTALEEWTKRGEGGKFVVKRVKNANATLPQPLRERMKSVGARFLGKPYDLTFEWSDEKIYCSELIWKIYKEGANLEVGKMQRLKDFDLSAEPVKQKLRERYGQNLPLEETVVSPAAIFESELLETVFAN